MNEASLQEELENSRNETNKARNEAGNLINNFRDKENKATALESELSFVKQERDDLKRKLVDIEEGYQRTNSLSGELSTQLQGKETEIEKLEHEKEQVS